MAATAASDITDGPVLSLINKRIRGLRKKYNRILQMEESISQGKSINKEQEEVLRSKPTVSALIDELEKLRQPLSSAVKKEVHLALQNNQIFLASQPLEENHQKSDEPESKKEDLDHVVLEDIINLLYFGSLFDVKSQNDFTSTMLTRTHERGCCLTYDYVTDDATDLLGEKDLDLIAMLGSQLMSRPADSSLSHKNALQQCVEHAKLWLARAEQPIEPNVDVTYANLREKLNKIMSSEYFTTSPEMKAPVEVAAAAAAGNYASFQVPVHDTMVAASVPVEVDGVISQSQEKDEGTADFQGHESGDDQAFPDGELQKEVEIGAENASEVLLSVQPEYISNTGSEHDEREHDSSDAKEKQYFTRRSYPNQRGNRRGDGGRRGYSNVRAGRGQGSYQNGRNQYYDQPGDYYPQNYNYRGRNGRGGGNSYKHHGSGGQVNDVSADVGVGS
ncbi:uncharacterized protein LOC129323205 isoform X2 [Prosopis cineraria]|uniref:uncharacterized protein LOC129323205 isoform X2 n=1 Tax=Prosopis cineraria TaxID=364024 RepID=UPI0024101011|nr:uncharacterized protein LOC129323205 isoform X2 [Prosopis cineraria]